MNAENFFEYLQSPSKLFQVSYQELKGLVLQYPFSAHLRYLLALKSKMENHPDFDQNLKIAAAFSPDRAHLYKLMATAERLILDADSYRMEEDFLELKDLSAIEESVEAAVNLPEEAVPQQIESIIENPLPSEEAMQQIETEILQDIFDEEEDLEALLEDEGFLESIPDLLPKDNFTGKQTVDLDELSGEVAPDADLIDPNLIANMAAFTELNESEPQAVPEEENLAGEPETDSVIPEAASDGPVEEIPLEIANPGNWEIQDEILPKPEAKTSFSSWLKQFQQPKPNLEFQPSAAPAPKEKPEKIKKKKKRKKKSEAKILAKKSIQVNEDVASETYAILLESQGHYTRAIRIYERLCLTFPEKSSFFAHQIEKLKKI